MKGLFHYLKNYKKQVILGPAFKLTEAIFELIVPLIMARMIDIGIKNHDLNYIFYHGFVILGLGLVGLVCSLICQYFAAIASQGIGTQLRNDCFAKINTFSHAEIDRFQTASLITRMTNDINQVQLAVAMLIRLALRAPFLVLGAAIMAISIDVQLSLIFFAAIPIIALVIYFIMSKSIPFYRTVQKRLDKISLITRENLEGIRVIRAFNKQQDEKKRFIDASDDCTNATLAVGKINSLLSPSSYIIMNFAIIFILYFGGYRVNIGNLSQGEVIALVNYMSQILLALIVVANLLVIFTKASACANRITEILTTESSITDPISPSIITPAEEVIRFENVSFQYPFSSKEILQELNFTFYAHQTIGVIGGTGSGKTTLVNLIERFYDVSQGKIYLFNQELNSYKIKDLHQYIALVPQNAILFAQSIRDNLKWGKEDAHDEEIIAALKAAQAYDFAMAFPTGLDTMIEQSGKNLSGGQKQRLTIARAIVAKSKILILDDSSSALDYATEAALRQALHKDQTRLCTLLVSQRINTIKDADQILVLDEGTLVGCGKHEDLYKNCAIYQEICDSQRNQETRAI